MKAESKLFRDLVEDFINTYGSEPSWQKLRHLYRVSRVTF